MRGLFAYLGRSRNLRLRSGLRRRVERIESAEFLAGAGMSVSRFSFPAVLRVASIGGRPAGLAFEKSS